MNNKRKMKKNIAQNIRARINKWDCIKLEIFCTKNNCQTEETTSRMREDF
jgi:hypothetical protein